VKGTDSARSRRARLTEDDLAKIRARIPRIVAGTLTVVKAAQECDIAPSTFSRHYNDMRAQLPKTTLQNAPAAIFHVPTLPPLLYQPHPSPLPPLLIPLVPPTMIGRLPERDFEVESVESVDPPVSVCAELPLQELESQDLTDLPLLTLRREITPMESLALPVLEPILEPALEIKPLTRVASWCSIDEQTVSDEDRAFADSVLLDS